jgi:hypothetical protein
MLAREDARCSEAALRDRFTIGSRTSSSVVAAEPRAVARMRERHPITEFARLIVTDPEYRNALTARLEARTEDPAIVQRLIAYARDRQATAGHAMARKILTDAGISWESL